MKTVLFQGDSITDAIRCRENDHYRGSGYATLVSAELCRRYPGQVKCINRGISGDRVVDILARMKRDILDVKPDVMSLLIGVNDVWHELGDGSGVPAPLFEQVLELIVTEIQRELPQTKLMLLEPFVLHGYNTDDSQEYPHKWAYFSQEVPLRAQAMRRVAQRHQLPCLSFQAQFDQMAEAYGSAWVLEDGVHPTIAGHTVIAQKWLETFDSLHAAPEESHS